MHTYRFRNNSSPSTGGGLHLSFLQEGREGSDNAVIVTDTQFTSNTAVYGGGVYFLPLGEHWLLASVKLASLVSRPIFIL